MFSPRDMPLTVLHACRLTELENAAGETVREEWYSQKLGRSRASIVRICVHRRCSFPWLPLFAF